MSDIYAAFLRSLDEAKQNMVEPKRVSMNHCTFRSFLADAPPSALSIDIRSIYGVEIDFDERLPDGVFILNDTKTSVIEAIIKRFQDAGFMAEACHSKMLDVDVLSVRKQIEGEQIALGWAILQSELVMPIEHLFAMADYRIYSLNQTIENKQYTKWLAGECAGEDPQMVIQMFQAWRAEAPNTLIAEGTDPMFRGVSIRWLQKASISNE